MKIQSLICSILVSVFLFGCTEENKNTITIDVSNNENNIIISTDLKLEKISVPSKLTELIEINALIRALEFNGITEFQEKAYFGSPGKTFIIGAKTQKEQDYSNYYNEESDKYVIIYDARVGSYYQKSRDFPDKGELVNIAKNISSICHVEFDDVIKSYTKSDMTTYSKCDDTITYKIKGIKSFPIQAIIDDDNAKESTIQLANQGDANAQYQLGMLYYYGKKGIKKDLEKAIEWLEKSARQDNADAQYQLGDYYYYRKPKELWNHDYSTAESWLKKSANQGHVKAQHQLGVYYSMYEKNKSKAMQWYQLACDNGDKDACSNLK